MNKKRRQLIFKYRTTIITTISINILPANCLGRGFLRVGNLHNHSTCIARILSHLGE